MSQSKQSVWRMISAGMVGGLVTLVFAQAMNRPEAQAQVGLHSVGKASIPAIEIGEGGIALVMGPGFQYFVVDRAGNAYPVRYRDQDATAPVGSTLLQGP